MFNLYILNEQENKSEKEKEKHIDGGKITRWRNTKTKVIINA
jgi:hypothetical protein